MAEIRSINPDGTNDIDEDDILSAKSWASGLFCEECLHRWTGKAPCTHCGEFSEPKVVTCREVLYGKSWAPWTWEKRYQFLDEDAESGSGASTTRRGAAAG